MTRDGEPPALDVTDVIVRFGGIVAADMVNLTVPAHGVVGLIGPNGAGKTTLVNVVSGVVQPSAGTVFINGVDRAGEEPYVRARSGLARTFQNLELFESLTVRENVAFRRDVMSGGWRVLALPAKRRVANGSPSEVDDVLAALKLTELRDVPVSRISYAERKLVEFGRAIVGNVKMLLLDEPVAGVALEDRPELIRRIDSVIRSRGLAALVVEHDLSVISAICEIVYVMNTGRIIAKGALKDILADDEVREAYLGRGASVSTLT